MPSVLRTSSSPYAKVPLSLISLELASNILQAGSYAPVATSEEAYDGLVGGRTYQIESNGGVVTYRLATAEEERELRVAGHTVASKLSAFRRVPGTPEHTADSNEDNDGATDETSADTVDTDQDVPQKAPASRTHAPRATGGERKADVVLAMLRRPGGARASELMETTGWQAHSLRGFLSGTIKKKMGLEVISAKGETGDRVYSVR